LSVYGIYNPPVTIETKLKWRKYIIYICILWNVYFSKHNNLSTYCSLSPVKSFTELVPQLFAIPGVKVFLSERINQDPLEKFFGCQRQRGGWNENPTVAEFYKNTHTSPQGNQLLLCWACERELSKPDNWTRQENWLWQRKYSPSQETKDKV